MHKSTTMKARPLTLREAKAMLHELHCKLIEQVMADNPGITHEHAQMLAQDAIFRYQQLEKPRTPISKIEHWCEQILMTSDTVRLLDRAQSA
jgi:hypothetical protein